MGMETGLSFAGLKEDKARLAVRLPLPQRRRGMRFNIINGSLEN